MTRRASGEGSIFTRSDGRVTGYITVPNPVTGKGRKVWRYGKTRQEVATKLAMLKDLYGKAPKAYEADVPFRDYALAWLSYQRPHVKARTHHVYESELRNSVLPHLGGVKLNAVSPQHVRAMQYAVLEAAGPVAARHARGRARTILQQAFEDGLIPRNPAQVVRPVKAPAKEIDVWGEEEIDTFLKVSEPTPQHPMFYLALMTGLRPGELLALEWRDIGEDELSVCRTITRPAGGQVLGPPKSRAGMRKVPLPTDAYTLLTGRAHDLAAKRYRRKVRDKDLVFPSSTGTMMSPRNVQGRLWVPLLEKARLPIVRPYVTRHTYASLQLAAGVDAATLAKWMGHSDASFTLRIYAHFFERREKLQAKTLNELLGRG
jgi:integrase